MIASKDCRNGKNCALISRLQWRSLDFKHVIMYQCARKITICAHHELLKRHRSKFYTLLVLKRLSRLSLQISHTVTWDCLKKEISDRFVARRNIRAAYVELILEDPVIYEEVFYPRSPALP